MDNRFVIKKGLQVQSAGASITGSIKTTDGITAPSFTGSVSGTSTSALSALSATSASFASYAPTASFSTTASYSEYIYYNVTESYTITALSASWATQSLSSSYILGSNVFGPVVSANSSSYILAAGVNGSVSSANTSVSASYALFASSAGTSTSSNTSTSASYALTSSFSSVSNNANNLGGNIPSYYNDAGNLTGTVAAARLSGNYNIYVSNATSSLTSTSSSYAVSASYAPFVDHDTILASGSSYNITSSWATNATNYNGSVVSASYSLSASYAPFTDHDTILASGSSYNITSSWATNASTSTSSSYALTSTTSSQALNSNNSITSSFSWTASNANNLGGNAGSYYTNAGNLTGTVSSARLTGHYNIDVSSATSSLTSTSASYILSSNISGTVSSASYAISASYAPFVDHDTVLASGSSYNITSSWATNATNYNGSVTSASYSLTSSYSLNGGSGGTTLTTGSYYPITTSYSLGSGTASYALYSPSAFTGSAIVFNSVSELRSNTIAYATNAPSYLLGYYTNIDSGSGLFYVDVGDSLTVDDSGSIFVDAINQRWKRLGVDRYNVKYFGAVGNGSTDDTYAITASVKAALSGILGGEIYFPPGTYVTSQTIYVSGDKSLVFSGDGETVSSIRTNSSTSPIVSVQSRYGQTFQGLRFDTAVARSTSSYAIFVNASGSNTNIRTLVDRCTITGSGYGIYLGKSALYSVDTCYIAASRVGIYTDNSSSPDLGDGAIVNSTIVGPPSSAGSVGILQYSGGGLKIQNSKIQFFDYGIAYDIQHGSTSILQIVGNSIENHTSYGVLLTRSSGSYNLLDITIANNQFGSFSGLGSIYNNADGFSNVVISDNVFVGTGTADGISATHLDTGTIVGNVFHQWNNAIVLGANCANIIYDPNVYESINTANVVNSSATSHQFIPYSSSYATNSTTATSSSYALTASYALNGGSGGGGGSGATASISAQAYNTVTQTIPNAAFTAITYNSDAWDTDNLHSTVTNTSRMTAPVTGKYRATTTVGFAGNLTGSRLVTFRVNSGSLDRYGYFAVPAVQGGLSNYITTDATLNLAVNDYVEVYAYQNSGGNLDTVAEGSPGINRFTLELVSADLGSGSAGTTLTTGSTYPITASWAVSASYALNGGGGSGTTLTTGSYYPITSSWSNKTTETTNIAVLSDAATIATNISLGNHFQVTLGGDRVLGNPTNSVSGKKVIWELIQDSVGGRQITFDTSWSFSPNLPSSSIVLSETTGSRDYLMGVYDGTSNKWNVIGFVDGFGAPMDPTYETTSSYTLTNYDDGKIVVVNNTIPTTITLPDSLTSNFSCLLYQSGSGVIVPKGQNSEIRAKNDLSSSLEQNSLISVLRLPDGAFVLGGTRQSRVNVVSSSFSNPFITNCLYGDHFRTKVTGNFQLSNPSNSYDGQRITWEFIQDSVGGHTCSFDTKFAFSTDLPISSVVLNQTSSKSDYMVAIYNGYRDTFDVVAFNGSF